MADGFLSRWSRRKLEVRAEEAGATSPPGSAAPTDEASPEMAGTSQESGHQLSPDEIAALPAIEDLTTETDVTAFLREGVPAALRNAALRRIWSLDPTIRDYVGDARDYAYDWNIAGGVPGNGPLWPTDDVGAMVDGIVGRVELAEPPGQGASRPAVGSFPPANGGDQEPGEPDAPEPAAINEAAAGGPAPMGQCLPEAERRGGPARCHGGAMPTIASGPVESAIAGESSVPV